MRQRQNLKNKRSSFTVIECLIVGAMLCALVWSFSGVKRLYTAMILASATDHIAAVCHYLAHCARARKATTKLSIFGTNGYCVHDGNERKEYVLPGGVEWGPSAGVQGPPSRPSTAVTSAVVGGQSDVSGVSLCWQASGACTPGTMYIHKADCCSAVSLPRAVWGVIRTYNWQNGCWIMRNG